MQACVQVAAIEETFAAAQAHPVHPTKPHMRALDVMEGGWVGGCVWASTLAFTLSLCSPPCLDVGTYVLRSKSMHPHQGPVRPQLAKDLSMPRTPSLLVPSYQCRPSLLLRSLLASSQETFP
eukprot:1159218-Pelagomonas_calceolata.AAC.2